MAPRKRAAPPEPWAEEQRRLAGLRVARDDVDWAMHGQFVLGLDRVAGVDVSFFPDSSYAVAAVVVLSFSSCEVLYARCAAIRLAVPYIPGYLAFREVPALATLLEEVPSALAPQVVMVDGNGAFHPRRCGAATHLGIITNLPTIGVAKKVQRVDGVNRKTAGRVAKGLRRASEWAPLGDGSGGEETEDEKEPLAMLLRPNSGKATVVVSAGHRVSLATAVRLAAMLCRKGRVPEPIRQADLQSRAAVREWFGGKELDGLEVREGLLPALPALPGEKRRAEEGEAGASQRAKGRKTEKKGSAGKADEAAKACGKPPGKAVLVWRVKAGGPEREGAAAEDGVRPAAEAAEVPAPALGIQPKERDVPEGQGDSGRRKTEKRAKVWRVKAAEAVEVAEGLGCGREEGRSEDCGEAASPSEPGPVGCWRGVLRWLGRLRFC